MRRPLFIFFTAIITITLTACGGSSTGPDTEDSDNNNIEPETYSVSVNMTPSDAGTVSPSLEDSYEEGKEIQLLANPADDYVFTGWTGDMEGSVNPLPLTVSQDFSITANFELRNYDLTVTTEGEGSVQENVLQQKSKEYEHGTAVELIATPAKGYKFMGWTGDVEGADNPAEITVDDPKEVTAVFEKKSYELAVTTQGSGAVSEQVVSKAKDYEYGDVVELSPSAAEGWKFIEWNGDLSGLDNPAQITVDTAKTVTAVFERKKFAMDITVQGEGSISKDPDQTEYEYGDKVTLTADPVDGWSFKEWAGEISGTTSEISVTVHSERDITAVFEEKPLFYLDKNGVTVVCPDAEPGQKGILNGEKYGREFEAVDRTMLDNKIKNIKDVTSVCTSPISNLSALLKDEENFDQNISSWDVSNVTKMDSLFFNASSFNGDINNWDVSSVTDMRGMFFNADSFNRDLNSWDVRNVMNMSHMFYSPDSLNAEIGNWDVSSVTDMSRMFADADNFNGDISSWDVSNVTDMSFMFLSNSEFNGDLSSWDMSSVATMRSMFQGATNFSGDISSWDVSNVTDMNRMFYGADKFSRDISSWDVSNVTDMYGMFYNAALFNIDISGWCVSQIDSEPTGFSTGSPLLDNYHPDWGAPCLVLIGT